MMISVLPSKPSLAASSFIFSFDCNLVSLSSDPDLAFPFPVRTKCIGSLLFFNEGPQMRQEISPWRYTSVDGTSLTFFTRGKTDVGRSPLFESQEEAHDCCEMMYVDLCSWRAKNLIIAKIDVCRLLSVEATKVKMFGCNSERSISCTPA